MKTKILYPVVFLISSLFLCPNVMCQVNQTDSLVLLTFNRTLGGIARVHWSGPVSTWQGITVRNNRVVGIGISYPSSDGYLTDSLGLLDSLQTLGVSEDFGCGGTLPPSLGNLHHLQTLVLNGLYHLSGTIPSSYGNMSSLRYLSLGFGMPYLTGPLPPEIFNCTNLDTLAISTFGGGPSPLPATIGQLTHLTYINLLCDLTGSIPPEIGNCTKLKNINLQGVGLLGSIPSSFKNLTQLTQVNLALNTLSGPINVFAADTSLVSLNLSSNAFAGNIPTSLQKLQHLQTLNLAGNQFSGSIPTFFTNMPALSVVNLGFNNLTGRIPSALGKISSLTYLSLRNNQLTGHIPAALGNLINAYQILLDYNGLTGTVPTAIADLKQLSTFTASHNELTGKIPTAFGQHYLLTLDVSSNKMNGDLSSFLSALAAEPKGSGYYNNFLPTNLYINNNRFYCSTNVQGKNGLSFYYLHVQHNRLTFDGLEFFGEGTIQTSFLNKELDSQAVLPIHMFNNGLAVSAGGRLSRVTYQWHKIGTTKTATFTGDSTFIPPASGKYYATITDTIVPGVTLYTDTFTYTKAAVALPANNLLLSVSPNPARDRLQLIGLSDKLVGKLTIADMSGYVWMSKMIKNQTNLSIDVSRLNPGNYLLNINDEKGVVKTIQFIKQ